MPITFLSAGCRSGHYTNPSLPTRCISLSTFCSFFLPGGEECHTFLQGSVYVSSPAHTPSHLVDRDKWRRRVLLYAPYLYNMLSLSCHMRKWRDTVPAFATCLSSPLLSSPSWPPSLSPHLACLGKDRDRTGTGERTWSLSPLPHTPHPPFPFTLPLPHLEIAPVDDDSDGEDDLRDVSGVGDILGMGAGRQEGEGFLCIWWQALGGVCMAC